jgi:hypothetical protein
VGRPGARSVSGAGRRGNGRSAGREARDGPASPAGEAEPAPTGRGAVAAGAGRTLGGRWLEGRAAPGRAAPAPLPPAGEPPDSLSPRPARRGGRLASRRLDAPGGRRAGPGVEHLTWRWRSASRGFHRLQTASNSARSLLRRRSACSVPHAGRTPVVRNWRCHRRRSISGAGSGSLAGGAGSSSLDFADPLGHSRPEDGGGDARSRHAAACPGSGDHQAGRRGASSFLDPRAQAEPGTFAPATRPRTEPPRLRRVSAGPAWPRQLTQGLRRKPGPGPTPLPGALAH